MCKSNAEGGHRCADGHRFASSDFTALELAPKPAPDRPQVEWQGRSLEPVRNVYTNAIMCAAFKTLKRHRAAEPRVTDSMERATPSGAALAGLNYRMKSPESVCEKIVRKQRAAVRQSVELEAEVIAASMKDVLRYTVRIEDHDRLAPSAHHLADALIADDWTVTEAENMFVPGNPYKGLHMTLRDPDGISAEVQVHSVESLRVKDNIHGLYVLARNSKASPKVRREAIAEMVRHSSVLSTPLGLDELNELGGCQVRQTKR